MGIQQNVLDDSVCATQIRCTNTAPDNVIWKHRKSNLNKDRVIDPIQEEAVPRHYKYVYPEFLPNPTAYLRDEIKEKLERKDMLKRRAVIDIPEFYVGTIMAVTISEKHSPEKKIRFVGLCTERGDHGTRHWFTLRNNVNGQGIEVTYEMYNPRILKIEVLKLEKRLDDALPYLKDAPLEYSSVPFDFAPVPHPPGAPVPVNTIKVRMNPYPWFTRWELRGFKGMEIGDSGVWPPRLKKMEHPENKREWEKYDLMKWYRESIDDDTAEVIMRDVQRGVTEIAEKKQPKRRF